MPIAFDEPNRIYQPLVREGRLKLPKGKLCPLDGTATLARTLAELDQKQYKLERQVTSLNETSLPRIYRSV